MLWLSKGVMKLMEGAGKLFDEVLRRITAWRLRACPVCRRRRLTQVETAMWTGIPGTVLCHTYRCLGCGEKAFAERYGSPMTMADHAVWREAKQMRILEYPSGSEFPTAAVRRRGRRS